MELRQGSVEGVAVNWERFFGGVFAGKTVLVTGHTGFKGAWLSLWLKRLGAKVVGFSLAPDKQPNLFEQLRLGAIIESHIGDVRDLASLRAVFDSSRPVMCFHLAAQPLVRRSYENPIETFQTNVLGTAHVLEAARHCDSIKACQVITSDKCYENREWPYAYRENDPMGGFDPYSASKGCAEIVVAAYRRSFLRGVSVSSARAGNVFGGGDWAEDRIIPDCVRALERGKPILVRNPQSVRPWQYVLDLLSGYLRLAALQLREPGRYAEAWNFGPIHPKSMTVSDLVEEMIRFWGSGSWFTSTPNGQAPHEARTLRLDCSKTYGGLGWRPVLTMEEAIGQTVQWYRAAQAHDFDGLAYSNQMLDDYVTRAITIGAEWTGIDGAPPLAAEHR